MKFEALSEVERIERYKYPKGTVRMVLDTDTFNEIDDQFAVTYALLSPDKIQLEAIYAAPFHNELSNGPEDGMEKSYEEIIRLLNRLHMTESIPVFRGATRYLPDSGTPDPSAAARNLVERARSSSPNDPLYVVAIGAITNVASAILMEPEIIKNIVVVWLGGHALHWSDTREFNLYQDIHAARTIFNCGVPLVWIPCNGVASHLMTTLSEMERFIKGQGEIGNYLYDVYKNCSDDHYGRSRVIWDISAIAYFINPGWVPTELVNSPVLNDGFTWSVNRSRHFIQCATFVHRDAVFRDLFRKIERHAKNS